MREILIKAISDMISGPGVRFTGPDMIAMGQPCVYMVMKAGKAMYVGMSRHGIHRITQKNHRQRSVIEDSDEILVYPCSSIENAKKLERIMIVSFRPCCNDRIRTAYVSDLMGIQRYRP